MPRPPTPQPQEPEEPPQAPQPPPPQPQQQPPPQPQHPRRRRAPVGEPTRRSLRDHAGTNPQWQKDNLETKDGNRPSEVDARTRDDGTRIGKENVDTLLSLTVLDAAQYKPGVPHTRHEAMRLPKASQWLAAEK
ncbi:hypothetical protein K474DRAFT_1714136, partial [Panus rudis PR-1116 ss-1]